MSDHVIAQAVSNLSSVSGSPSPMRSGAASIQPARPGRNQAFAERALQAVAIFWFSVAVVGQAIFFTYILSFYGGAVLAGDFARVNKILMAGHIHGDVIGNTALAVHLAIAAIITIGGPLQLIPQIRTNFPRFHRWNGRIYLVVAIVTSIAGSYMVWTRAVAGDVVQHIGTTSNAVAIVLCAIMALRHALARNFVAHRRWALRLFLTVSGVWFFRVGLMFSLLVNKGPFGFNPDTFQGPFLSFLSFAQFLVPLGILEIYLRARDSGNTYGKFATASGLLLLSIAMGGGIFAAAMFMWLPHI